MAGVSLSNTASHVSNTMGGVGGRRDSREEDRSGAEADAADLAKGVASMSVDSKLSDPNVVRPVLEKKKNSGLDSYMDNSSSSVGMKEESYEN